MVVKYPVEFERCIARIYERSQRMIVRCDASTGR